MQDESRAHDDELSPSTAAESEVKPQLQSSAVQPDKPVPEAPRPEKSKTTSNREKTMAASALGSEYWLP